VVKFPRGWRARGRLGGVGGSWPGEITKRTQTNPFRPPTGDEGIDENELAGVAGVVAKDESGRESFEFFGAYYRSPLVKRASVAD
jgi:hypothetical protein